MIRAGYRPPFAAGVEACASMGGQLIPPVMGAAAFIMAETLGLPYSSIAIAAAIPGVLYFVAVGVMVHFEAARLGIPVLPRAELPRFLDVLKRDAHLLAGPAVLVYFLVVGRSPLFAGFWALVAAVVASQLRRDTRIDLSRALTILTESAQSALPVALACATVGIVVGVVSATGLGLKLASGIVGIAQGNMLATLLLTMVAALVLGTGLPTSATYIITSIMAAPALVQLGRSQAGRPHVRVLLRDPGGSHSTHRHLDLRHVLDRGRRRLEDAVDGHGPGSFGFHHPVQLCLRSCSAPAQRLGATHRSPDGGRHPRHPHARGWPHRLPAGAHLRVGAGGAPGRGGPADLPGVLGDLVGMACFIAVWLAQRRAGRRVEVRASARATSPKSSQ